MTTDAKTRINMRISREALDTIREAANAQQQDLTSFVLGAAMERARSVVLESRVTRLTAAEALRLDDALRREGRAIPELVEAIRSVNAERIAPPATSRDAQQALYDSDGLPT
jgi:uncharacterized protein (DUF1778 family)